MINNRDIIWVFVVVVFMFFPPLILVWIICFLFNFSEELLTLPSVLLWFLVILRIDKTIDFGKYIDKLVYGRG